MEKLLNNEFFEFQKDLLTKEIEYIHSRIAAYDDISFKIKGWAVTIWSAVVAIGIKEKYPLIVFTSLPALMAFWILDAYFKQYQRRSMTRMGVIEMFLDSRSYFKDSGMRTAFEKKDFGPFPVHDPIASRTRNLNENIKKWYRDHTSLQRSFLVPNVRDFYLILNLGAIAILLLLLMFAN